jgi:hypothetical protein
MGKNLNEHFSKKDKWPQVYEEMIIHQEGKANELRPHIRQKDKRKQMSVRTKKKELSYTVGL